jgi:hypothetical protein
VSDKTRIEELEEQGWEKQFIASEPRLSEAVELYRESGFEVHLEPLQKCRESCAVTEERDQGECRACFNGFEDLYKIIFTRPLKDR